MMSGQMSNQNSALSLLMDIQRIWSKSNPLLDFSLMYDVYVFLMVDVYSWPCVDLN